MMNLQASPKRSRIARAGLPSPIELEAAPADLSPADVVERMMRFELAAAKLIAEYIRRMTEKPGTQANDPSLANPEVQHGQYDNWDSRQP